MDMFDFWARYMRRAVHETEEEKKEMLKELGFQGMIDPNNEEEFYNYLNRVMASFSSYSRERVLTAYKQGQHMGRLNTLTNKQRTILTQTKYVEEDTTEGPHSGDQEGFEDSFIDIEKVNAADEFRQAYEDEGEEDEESQES